MKKNLLCYAFLCWLQLSYAQNGDLNPSFGNKGIVITGIGSPFDHQDYTGKQILLNPDGSMYFINKLGFNIIITKKNADGSTDLSYGQNGHSVSAPIAVYNYNSPSGPRAALQADGKILVVGEILNNGFDDGADFALARFNTDGTLDSSFSSDGIAITNFGYRDEGYCMAIQNDGKIVVGGTSWAGNGGELLAIARYNTDGSLDKQISSNQFYLANSMAIQGDGKIVFSGRDLIRFDQNLKLDSSFNGTGYKTIGAWWGEVAIQADGKIVVAGLDDGGGSPTGDFTTARYNTDGSADISFGSNGIQNTDFGASERVGALTIQPDGKILVAGSTGTINDSSFAVARYNIDGSLDNSFSGDGMQTTSFGISQELINSVVVQGDGKIVALGYTVSPSYAGIAAVRYDNAGNPDNSFDGDGLLSEILGQGATAYTCTAIQADGKVVAAGFAWNGSNYDFALARYNSDGSLDNSFSGDGIQMTDFGSSNDTARAIVIQADGKILLAGTTGNDFGVARYNTNGTPDSSFDGDGMLTTDFGGFDFANSIAVQKDGKILVGGSALARYNTNGALDQSFDGDGKSTTQLGGQFPFSCRDLALQSNGKIIVMYNRFGVCISGRYNTDGSIDSTFGVNGARAVDIPDYSLFGSAIVIQNDDKVLIGGYYSTGFRITVSAHLIIRLGQNGELEGEFIREAPLGSVSIATDLALQSDGKIILGGYTSIASEETTNARYCFSMARYNLDGSLDSSFGDNGKLITKVSLGENTIAGLAISGNSLYAVGYGQYPGYFGVVAKYTVDVACAPLPVTLTDFTAALRNRQVTLRWQTENEENLAGFIIQRSADGNNFLPIESMTAKSNGGLKTTYSTLDKQPLAGTNFYRLKMIDRDGKFTNSKVVSVNINQGIFTWQAFPNPVTNILYVKINGRNEQASLQVIDAFGKILEKRSVAINGASSLMIHTNTLAKGIYTLQLQTATITETRQFIKQ